MSPQGGDIKVARQENVRLNIFSRGVICEGRSNQEIQEAVMSDRAEPEALPNGRTRRRLMGSFGPFGGRYSARSWPDLSRAR
jgi:hypothetical protein